MAPIQAESKEIKITHRFILQKRAALKFNAKKYDG
jgi:hypothetical protein